jgi:hypothetical protein
MVRADTDPPDPAQLAEASRLVAEGRGDELVRSPNRSFASYISAARFLEGANTSAEFKDFFGVPELAVRCQEGVTWMELP